ncbi:hypothetical protein GBA52_020913 [Prunus armeniaca]|nr:hypothetical protein GBA52_020913 [Prunus armeniaca]
MYCGELIKAQGGSSNCALAQLVVMHSRVPHTHEILASPLLEGAAIVAKAGVDTANKIGGTAIVLCNVNINFDKRSSSTQKKRTDEKAKRKPDEDKAKRKWIRACIDVEWAYATITIEMIVARNVGEQMLEKGLRMVDQLDRSSVLCSTFAAL